MSMTPRLPALAAALVIVLAGGARGADFDAGRLHISHPWSRPSPPGAAAAVGYMRITNTGRYEDVLKGGVSSEVVRIEVHHTSFDGGIMRMRPVEGGLRIKPGETVTLGPGGQHLMLVGPRRPFKAGERIPATLTFARAGVVRITFDVEQPGSGGGDMRPGASR